MDSTGTMVVQQTGGVSFSPILKKKDWSVAVQQGFGLLPTNSYTQVTGRLRA